MAATTVLIGTPSYLYYKFTKQQTFDLAVRARDADGKSVMATRTFFLLSKDAVRDRLVENATSDNFSRPEGTVWRYATASVAANDPLEDAHADAIIARDPSDPSAPGDWLFFTVMDGHGGPHTSRLLSKTLISAVVLELSSLIHHTDGAPRSGFLEGLKSIFRTSSPKLSEDAQNPERISLAIQNAFTKLDKELINAPLSVLAAHLDAESIKKNSLPDLSKHPLALQTMLPAVSGTAQYPRSLPYYDVLPSSGSCALMAIFDTTHRHLYVACSGDSRAVAGIWEENDQGRGSWRVEVLSEDQTGRNPNELKRFAKSTNFQFTLLPQPRPGFNLNILLMSQETLFEQGAYSAALNPLARLEMPDTSGLAMYKTCMFLKFGMAESKVTVLLIMYLDLTAPFLWAMANRCAHPLRYSRLLHTLLLLQS